MMIHNASVSLASKSYPFIRQGHRIGWHDTSCCVGLFCPWRACPVSIPVHESSEKEVSRLLQVHAAKSANWGDGKTYKILTATTKVRKKAKGSCLVAAWTTSKTQTDRQLENSAASFWIRFIQRIEQGQCLTAASSRCTQLWMHATSAVQIQLDTAERPRTMNGRQTDKLLPWKQLFCLVKILFMADPPVPHLIHILLAEI